MIDSISVDVVVRSHLAREMKKNCSEYKNLRTQKTSRWCQVLRKIPKKLHTCIDTYLRLLCVRPFSIYLSISMQWLAGFAFTSNTENVFSTARRMFEEMFLGLEFLHDTLFFGLVFIIHLFSSLIKCGSTDKANGIASMNGKNV